MRCNTSAGSLVSHSLPAAGGSDGLPGAIVADSVVPGATDAGAAGLYARVAENAGCMSLFRGALALRLTLRVSI